MGIKLAIFRNKKGKTASLDIGPTLKHLLSPPKKWFDPILKATVWRRSHVNCSCMTCGRRLWFWWLSCPKPRCILARLETRRAFKGQDWEFDDLVDFDGDQSDCEIEVFREDQEDA